MKYFVLFAASILFSTVHACTEDPPSSSTVMQQAIRSRERLRSGNYVGRGVRVEKPQGRPIRVVDLQHTCLFDFDLALQRVNYTETPHDGANNEQQASSNSALLYTTPDYFLSKPTQRRNQINIYRAPVVAAVWDPRNVGFLSAVELGRMVGFDEIRPILEEGAASDTASIAIRSEDNSRVEVSFMTDFQYFGYVRKFTFQNMNGDFVPTAREDRRLPYSPEGKPAGDGAVESDVKVNWVEHNGTVVPMSVSMTQYLIDTVDGKFAAIEETSTEIQYEWEMVNGEIDPHEFDLEPLLKRLDDPPGSHVIVDARVNPPIFLQHPRVPDGKLLRKIQDANQPVAAKDSVTRSRSHTWIIVANIGIFAALGLYFLVRRLRSSQSNKP